MPVVRLEPERVWLDEAGDEIATVSGSTLPSVPARIALVASLYVDDQAYLLAYPFVQLRSGAWVGLASETALVTHRAAWSTLATRTQTPVVVLVALESGDPHGHARGELIGVGSPAAAAAALAAAVNSMSWDQHNVGDILIGRDLFSIRTRFDRTLRVYHVEVGSTGASNTR